MKRVYADHHACVINSNGIKNFYWPILHKDMTAFGERFFYECADILREYPDQKSALIYKFCVKYLIAVAGGIFQSDLLKAALEKDGVELIVPDTWLVWPHTIIQNRPPPRLPFLEKLRRQKKPVSIFDKLLNFKKIKKPFSRMKFGVGTMEIDGLKVFRPTTDILKNKILATQRTDLISRYAKSLKEDVVLCRSDRWYSPISKDDYKKALSEKTSSDDFLEDSLIRIVEKLYAERGVVPSSFVANYLLSILSEMATLLRIHYNRLLIRGDIPARLWTGTGGEIWDLMLRSAVLEKGGHVTGFDHGGGTVHVSIPLLGFIELWACNKFVTFNERQVNDIKKNIHAWPKLDRMNIDIDCVPKKSSPPKFFIHPEFEKGIRPIRKIFVLSTLYDQDRGRSFAFYPDHVYVDWQARLMAKLKKWGYDVYFKPHPESQSPPPGSFEKSLGVTIIHDNFENILDQADLFIIDYTYTSIMIPAFLTNIPIVLVDFDNLPWNDGARELIQKRASLVECGFDNKNRVSIDWNELKNAIENSSKKCNNHEYANAYYI